MERKLLLLGEMAFVYKKTPHHLDVGGKLSEQKLEGPLSLNYVSGFIIPAERGTINGKSLLGICAYTERYL